MEKKQTNGWTSDDWYLPGEGQLHFFQRQRLLLWVMGKEIYARAEAWGGQAPVPGVNYGRMKPQLTTAGTYVVHECAPYTTSTWPLSQIPWGTPVKLDPRGEGILYQVSRSQRRWRYLPLGHKVLRDLRESFQALYEGKEAVYDANGDGFPDVWVFNDFGPWSVRYFLDPNRNRAQDKGEKLKGEMIHTTPRNEADKTTQRTPYMEYSHGCVHVKPADRDKFQSLGAFTRGNLFVVHAPSEVVPEFLTES
ncbi:MAG: L,D-transpeptidase family protein [Pseudomonadota bacterium]